MSATFGGGGFPGADAVTAGALTPATAVNRPASSVTAPRRARQRHGVRASFIVLLRSAARSPRLLLERRHAGPVGVLAQPLEGVPIALQIAIEEVQRNVRDRRRRRLGRAAVGRRVAAADEREEVLRRARLGERVGAALVGEGPVRVAVLGEQGCRDAGEELRRATRDDRKSVG